MTDRRVHRVARDPSDLRDRFADLTDLQTPRALSAAATLGIADLLASSPRTAAELARATDTKTETLQRLLRLLTAHDVLHLTDGRYSLSSMGQLLRRDHPGSFWPQLVDTRFNRVLDAKRTELVSCMRSDSSPVDAGPLWEILRRDDRSAEIFNEMMLRRTADIAERAFTAWHEEWPRFIVDIGTGPGHFLKSALMAFPDSEGIALDIYPAAGQSLYADNVVAGRFQTIITDMFSRPLPTGGDLYLICSVLHNLTDELCLELLKVVRDASSSSTVVIIERCLSDPSSGVKQRRLDIDMLAAFGGQERTVTQMDRLLAQAGFRRVDLLTLTRGYARLAYRWFSHASEDI